MAEVVVVGAGPAGISVGLALQDRGVRAVVVERAPSVAASWQARYDRLRLNTSRPFSHLPGRRFARGTPMFPTRDQYVAYLQGHAASLDVRLDTTVDKLSPDGARWSVETDRGVLGAEHVVVATGFENQPVVPEWPGRDQYPGVLVHSSRYRNPAEFLGLDVLVVGPGCSGMEIAHDLALGGARRVRLAVRTPPNIVLRSSPGPVPGDFIGVPLMRAPVVLADRLTRWGQRSDTGDLSAYGLPFPDEGVYSQVARRGIAPTVVDREVVEAIKAGAFDVVAAVERFEQSTVYLADGTSVEPDAIVCATGYRRNLEGVVGALDVLDERGWPRSVGARSAADGLWFAGFVPRPGALGYMGRRRSRSRGGSPRSCAARGGRSRHPRRP